MISPTPFTVLQGADDVACVEGVCAIPAATADATEVDVTADG